MKRSFSTTGALVVLFIVAALIAAARAQQVVTGSSSTENAPAVVDTTGSGGETVVAGTETMVHKDSEGGVVVGQRHTSDDGSMHSASFMKASPGTKTSSTTSSSRVVEGKVVQTSVTTFTDGDGNVYRDVAQTVDGAVVSLKRETLGDDGSVVQTVNLPLPPGTDAATGSIGGAFEASSAASSRAAEAAQAAATAALASGKPQPPAAAPWHPSHRGSGAFGGAAMEAARKARMMLDEKQAQLAKAKAEHMAAHHSQQQEHLRVMAEQQERMMAQMNALKRQRAEAHARRHAGEL